MRSRMGGLRRQFMENQLMTTKMRGGAITDETKRQNVIEWITFYRRNWHIYVMRVLQIKLKPFQQIMLYIMGISDTFFAICARGLSKSWIIGVAAIVKMNLYPYSRVVITSSTLEQANKLADKKIRDELIKKLSPYLLYMYEHEYLVITKPGECTHMENKLNGSTLDVLPCLDSARGERATMLIYEECRLLKKSLIDSIFEKMAQPRQAIFLEKEEYLHNRRWIEQCQRAYITSARFSFEWYYAAFKRVVSAHYTERRSVNNVFAADIFIGIENQLKTWADYRKGKRDSESDWRMEDLNEVYQEAEGAFFSIQQFKENQSLENCFKPPTTLDYILDNDNGFPKKKDGEIRMVVADYAFATATSRTANDNTVIICISAHWKKNHFERHVDYIEGWNASDSIGACDRVRYLFWTYEADYVVMDSRSGGEVLTNHITEPLERADLGVKWNSHGLGLARKYQVVPQAKQDDYVNRTVDKNAISALIPFIGTAELNALAWVALHRQLECNTLKFLVPLSDKQDKLLDSKEYYRLTSEELAQALAPYGQTDLMIMEAVNLKTEFAQGKLKLSEPKTGTKDRIVALAYGNYILDLIENDWLKGMQEDEIDINDIQLVF